MYSTSASNAPLLNQIKFFKEKDEVIEFTKTEGDVTLKDQNEIKEPEILELIRLIKDYLTGRSLNLYKEVKDLNISLELEEKFPTHFSQKVMRTLLDVKPGKTTSYYSIAEEIDSKAYQAIGTIMRNNQLPLIVPCHRVLKKDGSIGGFMGATKEGWETNVKKTLLSIESGKN